MKCHGNSIATWSKSCYSNVYSCVFTCGPPGVLELTVDNRTISGETINAVERLSLYPEIITAFVYRVTESQVSQGLMGFFCYLIYQHLEFIFGGLAMYMSQHILANKGNHILTFFYS